MSLPSLISDKGYTSTVYISTIKVYVFMVDTAEGLLVLLSLVKSLGIRR